MHPLTHTVRYTNCWLTPTQANHIVWSLKGIHRHVHKQHRSRVHTWKAHTVQTWEEAFLFCRRHANLQGGRNNRHQPCLCLPMELHCPLCLSHLLICLWWHNARHEDTHRLHLITLWSFCTMADLACVSVCDIEAEDVRGSENMRRQTTVESSQRKLKPSI